MTVDEFTNVLSQPLRSMNIPDVDLSEAMKKPSNKPLHPDNSIDARSTLIDDAWISAVEMFGADYIEN